MTLTEKWYKPIQIGCTTCKWFGECGLRNSKCKHGEPVMYEGEKYNSKWSYTNWEPKEIYKKIFQRKIIKDFLKNEDFEL